MKLVGTLEAAHCFQKSGTPTSGEVIGLFDFDLLGPVNQRDWLRAGIVIEGKLAGGSASLTLNATYRGETPAVWLSATWQIQF